MALFGARAEPLAKLLHKGSRVLVEGRLQTSSYEKDGSRRYKTEVIATDLILGGFGASGLGASGSAAGGAALGRESAAAPRSRALAVAADDVPF